MKTVGIIDLGSNSMRASVVCFSENSHRTIFMDKRTVKLSENMNNDMNLKPEAIVRTINALNEFKNIFNSLGVTNIVAVATAAVRKAANGKEFLVKVKNDTGIDLEIIDGKKEAEFDYLAVKNTVDFEDYIIMDIGGGSTEIIGIRSGKLCDFISIPYASRNITEVYLTPENKQSILNAEKKIFDIVNEIKWLKLYKNVPIIGLGGCLRAIGKADASVHKVEYKTGNIVNIQFIKDLYNRTKEMSINERIELFGESKGDIILGGAIPLISVISILNPSGLHVSDKGVRDGIVYSVLMDTIKKA